MNRYIYFDILRIIAVFAVIMLHVSARRFYVSFPSNEWEFLNFYDSISRWGVPVFVMISGALFLDTNKLFSLKRLFKKNVVRILAALIFWSLIYEFYKMNGNTTLLHFLYGVVKGPGHLWFLKMLLGLYVSIPILRLVIINREIEIYFLIVSILSTFIIPFIPGFLGLYDPLMKNTVEKLIDTIGLNIATGYIGYFVLGHILNTTIIKPKVRITLYALGILSVLFVIALTSIFSHRLGVPTVMLYNNLTLFTLLEAIAIFVFVKYNLNYLSDKSRLLVRISKYTFGIYLVHILVIKVANDMFGINSSIFYSAIYVPCFSILVFIISYGIILVLDKVPIVNRYFM